MKTFGHNYEVGVNTLHQFTHYVYHLNYSHPPTGPSYRACCFKSTHTLWDPAFATFRVPSLCNTACPRHARHDKNSPIPSPSSSKSLLFQTFYWTMMILLAAHSASRGCVRPSPKHDSRRLGHNPLAARRPGRRKTRRAPRKGIHGGGVTREHDDISIFRLNCPSLQEGNRNFPCSTLV